MPEPAALTPAVFEILLSLAGGERHGYAILRDVEERTGGSVVLHAGTLYRALGRMVDDGWIEETPSPASSGGRAAALLPDHPARCGRGAGGGGSSRAAGGLGA